MRVCFTLDIDHQDCTLSQAAELEALVATLKAPRAAGQVRVTLCDVQPRGAGHAACDCKVLWNGALLESVDVTSDRQLNPLWRRPTVLCRALKNGSNVLTLRLYDTSIEGREICRPSQVGCGTDQHPEEMKCQRLVSCAAKSQQIDRDCTRKGSQESQSTCGGRNGKSQFSIRLFIYMDLSTPFAPWSCNSAA
jgi:hypothetical protein